MYYRTPKEYLIPVVIGDITEEGIEIIKTPIKKESLVEKIALEEADKEFIESQIKGYYSEKDEYYSKEGKDCLIENEYYSKINEYIE